MSACCDSRARRERKREKEKKRETLRKKNSSSFPLNSVSVCWWSNETSFPKKMKKEGKKKEVSFSSFAGCLLHLSASVDSLRSFSSSSISSSDSYWNQWIMNTQTLYFKWLWWARAARRRRKRQRKFRNLIVSLSPPHFDETTRRWEKKNHHNLI
mgnify:CR=1 FL=1